MAQQSYFLAIATWISPTHAAKCQEFWNGSVLAPADQRRDAKPEGSSSSLVQLHTAV